MSFVDVRTWTAPSSDPHDEQFGDVIEATRPENADSYDAVLVGEPYDGAVIGRPGAREGPTALRTALAATKTYYLNGRPVGAIGDLGDIDIPSNESVRTAQSAVQEATTTAHELDTVPVFLGGDNSLTYPNVVPLLNDGSVGAISFDAHFDCRAVRGQPSSGTPYRQLYEDGLDAFAVVGARHFENSTEYAEYVDECGGAIVSADDVADDPIAAVDRALAAMTNVDAVYVSVDLDVLNAPEVPGVSAPTPGGISTRELFRMVRRATSIDRLAGFEVVECAPPLEDGDRTARAGARAVAYALSGIAESATDDSPAGRVPGDGGDCH
ncbi:formimidoylglutamase [Halosolutus amylolyticus]|uniref:Formimidoylglutamase n=1 Tax=Halosolutus amylolyticus TaxID=2932267 RepID=A0ABD5PJI6_9EURY|nr:formimidoylglutamase [Halosolutus amylolyticus]